MPFFLLHGQNDFPDVELADEDGLLAFGSNFSVETLLKAYKKGIFPWYNEDEPICWYSPNPRFVLFPDKLKISSSMKTVIKSRTFKFSADKAFADVIRNCRLAKRKGDPGTWITDEIENAYQLFLKMDLHTAQKPGIINNWPVDCMVFRWAKFFLGKACFPMKAMRANLHL